MDLTLNLFSSNNTTDSNNDTKKPKTHILFNLDVIITRTWGSINFILYVIILVYNIYHLIKTPESTPPKLFVTIHLFCICALYSFTFMLPLTQTDESTYTTSFYFTIKGYSGLCSFQGVFHCACLLGMVALSLCIAISCYFSFFKKQLSKKIELIMCSAAWIIPLIICLFALFEGMQIDENNLCWPKNVIWRIVFDTFFCLSYLLNLIVIVVIVIKLVRLKKENRRKYIIKTLLLGIVLFTLLFYFCDLIHSWVVNFCLATNLCMQNKPDSNIDNMWFILLNDTLGLGTGICLMFVYKPKFPKILCCKEMNRSELPEFGESDDDNENEMMEVNSRIN